MLPRAYFQNIQRPLNCEMAIGDEVMVITNEDEMNMLLIAWPCRCDSAIAQCLRHVESFHCCDQF